MGADSVLEEWLKRSGEYSPDYYAYYGPNDASESVLGVLDDAVSRDASVLELGCSSGRHLAHLYEHGYTDVSGVDINADAFDVMAEAYPDLADAGSFYTGAIEDVVAEFEDDAFDVVYSVETLQHIHPEEAWVFEELVRITNGLLCTVENEGGDDAQGSGDVNYVHGEFPLYYRDWNEIFTGRGLEEVASESTRRDTMRVFRVPGEQSP